jgi:hypothetical protein
MMNRKTLGSRKVTMGHVTRLCCALTLGTAAFGVSQTAVQAQRNAWSWPFAWDSIWNMPIHTSANYGWAGFQNEPNGVNIELEYIVYTDASTPMRTVYYPFERTNGTWGSYRADGNKVAWLSQTRVPNWFYVPDITYNPYSTPNACTAFVYGPNGDLTQFQPTTRLSSTGPIWGYPHTGQNIYGQGEKGTHYGSGLSTMGGSIRSGELTSSTPIRHALKFLCQGKKYLYAGTPNGPGARGYGWKWPADRADSYANNSSDPNRYGGTNPEVAQGSLVAIPGWKTVNDLGLSDNKAKKIAQALLDYGAYIVDDTAYTNYAFAVSQEAQNDFNSIPKADLMKIVTNLWVVTNNGPNSKGGKTGSGVPRVSYAPGF